MGRTIMGAAVSLDGYMADDDDNVGPLFDWFGNGDVEWGWSEDHEDAVAPRRRPGTSCGRCTRGSARW